MSAQFEKGDRVEYVAADPDTNTPELEGQLGTVVSATPDAGVEVDWDDRDARNVRRGGFLPVNLRKVEPEPLADWERELLSEVDAEDKADLYVEPVTAPSVDNSRDATEPEPLKEGDWVQVWAQILPSSTAMAQGWDEHVSIGGTQARAYIRNDAIIRPAEGQTPPWVKAIEEPMGLGAVVEADAGNVLATAFVRTGTRESHPWCMGTTRAYYAWAEFRNARVLSEGITEGGAS